MQRWFRDVSCSTVIHGATTIDGAVRVIGVRLLSWFCRGRGDTSIGGRGHLARFAFIFISAILSEMRMQERTCAALIRTKRERMIPGEGAVLGRALGELARTSESCRREEKKPIRDGKRGRRGITALHVILTRFPRATLNLALLSSCPTVNPPSTPRHLRTNFWVRLERLPSPLVYPF